MNFPRLNRKAFSLIELVIVVVIIGIIAAIAVPRMSRGATAAGESALRANLTQIRNALELYRTEIGTLPTVAAAGTALTSATTIGSNTFGPYLRVIPTLPNLQTALRPGGNLIAGADAANVGWLLTISGSDFTLTGNFSGGSTYLTY